MEITLNRLTIDDFAGIKNIDFNFNDKDAIIYGANATGKTTTAVALNWLLFGKTLEGRTVENVVPLNDDGTENWELVPTVTATLTIDGVQKTYKKESRPVTKNNEFGQKEYRNSRKTEQYIDDVPYKITDFNKEIEEIIDENIFKLITNIYEFSNMHWQEKRKLLFDMTESVTDEDIFENNKELQPLKELLKDSTQEELTKKYNSQLKKSKEDLKNIPIKIDTLHNQMPEEDNEDYSARVEALYQNISEINQEIIQIRNGKKLIELKNERVGLISEMNYLKEKNNNHNYIKIDGLERELLLDESDIENIERQAKELNDLTNNLKEQTNTARNEWIDLNNDIKSMRAEQFEQREDGICKCCGQKLPPEKIEEHLKKAQEEFNLKKSQQLERKEQELNLLASAGKRNTERLKNNQKEIDKKLKQRDELKEQMKVKETQLERLKANSVDVEDTDEYKALQVKLEKIEKALEDVQVTNDEAVAEFDEALKEKQSELDELLDKRAVQRSARRLQDEINVLKHEEGRLRELIEHLQHKLFMLNRFTVDKVNLITDKVNSKFKLAQFKMFNQLVNGDLKETCEIMVDGVSFDKGLNNAMKINVALDIIETISKHYNTYAPIFVDNSESVTDVKKTTSQQIHLQVSPLKKHKKLELEIKGDK